MAQVRTRKRGKTYSYIFEAGKKDDGKRKVVEKGGFATQKEAYKAGVEAYTDWLHGNIGITSEKVTLKDFMTNWLANVVALNVKATTLQHYTMRFKDYIMPTLGEKSVQELTPAIIDNFMRNLTAKGYARNTLSVIHMLLSQALDYAVYPAQIISSNPAKYIKVSKKAPTKVIQRTVISKERFDELLAKYPFGTAMYIPLLLLYHTGMRIGEVCGLTWQDVDLEHRVIHLNQQLVYLPKNGLYFSTPKTEASTREIIIDNFLAGELRRWKYQQLNNKTEAGDAYIYVYRSPDNKILQQSKPFDTTNEKVAVVCTYNNGRIIRNSTIANMLFREKLNAHSFRHTHATILIENGATPKGVAERLGHANAVITQNLYTHNTKKLQDDTLAIFEKTMQTNL